MTYKMSIQDEQAWFFPPAVCENTMITENLIPRSFPNIMSDSNELLM